MNGNSTIAPRYTSIVVTDGSVVNVTSVLLFALFVNLTVGATVSWTLNVTSLSIEAGL